MANPNPTRKGDYRDVKNPKVMTRDVLIWMVQREAKEGVAVQFIPEDISIQFNITPADASCRLLRLKSWHCVTIKVRGKGRSPHRYEVTAWGEEMARKWGRQ